MIRITSVKDLGISLIPQGIKEYLSEYLKTILSAYECSNLQNIGCIFYFESNQDTQKYHDMGLNQPIKNVPLEYSEVIPIKDSHGERKLLHGCYVFNNDFAIDFFGQEDIFDDETKQVLLENSKG